MTVDDNLVDKIAELARLEFHAEAKEEIKTDLNKMLSFVEKLNELDTTNVEPLVYITETTNVLRNDEPHGKDVVKQTDALKNAPKKDSDYFKVPKVIQKN